MKRILFLNSFIAFIVLSSCKHDNKADVYYYIENHCNDTLHLKFIKHSDFNLVGYETLGDKTININTDNQSITIPKNKRVQYRYLIKSSKKGEIDTDNDPYNQPTQFFTDSVTIIFSDSTTLLHTLKDNKSSKNILKRETYTRTSEYVYTLIITEDDHQAAIEACGM